MIQCIENFIVKMSIKRAKAGSKMCKRCNSVSISYTRQIYDIDGGLNCVCNGCGYKWFH
jgi:hypothetical protein